MGFSFAKPSRHLLSQKKDISDLKFGPVPYIPFCPLYSEILAKLALIQASAEEPTYVTNMQTLLTE